MKSPHSRFYLIITILFLMVVLLGFGPRFYLRPFFEQPRHMQMETLPIQFILHGILMTFWYVLLVVQSALVNTKNIKLHMRPGWGLGIIAILAVISAIPVMMGFAPRMVELGFLDVTNADRIWFQNIQWTNDIFALITFTARSHVVSLQPLSVYGVNFFHFQKHSFCQSHWAFISRHSLDQLRPFWSLYCRQIWRRFHQGEYGTMEWTVQSQPV